MSLVEHAKVELEKIGQFEEDPVFAQSLVAAVAAFSSYGHSGGSHFAAVSMLNDLLQFKTLSPLTDDPDEWMYIAEDQGGPLYQSRRRPDAFSYDGGKTYYTLEERDAIGGMEFVPFHKTKKVNSHD